MNSPRNVGMYTLLNPHMSFLGKPLNRIPIKIKDFTQVKSHSSNRLCKLENQDYLLVPLLY